MVIPLVFLNRRMLPQSRSVRSLRILLIRGRFKKHWLFQKCLKVIFDYLFEDIKDNIDSQRFEFRPWYNTLHYLVALLNTILRHLEKMALMLMH